MFRQGLSLRVRLNLMIVLTLLSILGLGTAFAVHNARRAVAEEIASSVNLTLQLLEASLTDNRDSMASLNGWLARIGRLDQTRHLRIQVWQAPEGQALRPPDPLRLPERNQAASFEGWPVPAWFAWSVAPSPSVVEKRVERPGDHAILIRIEAHPQDEILEAWNEARGFLMLIGLLAAVIYVLVHITVGRAFRSVGLILEGLKDIEKGAYGKRLPPFPLPEFTRISRAFNHMAAGLDKARDDNRALAQHSLAIQEEERRRLARELHDELGQSVTAIKVMAASLRRSGGDRQHAETVEEIMAICDRLFGVVRAMMRRLHPILLDELGLTASLEDLIENWRARHPQVALEFRCDERVEDCVGAGKIHLFRIVQECLTNASKHAQAARVRIALDRTEPGIQPFPGIRLAVDDDGRGFDPNQPPRGFGLLGIRERVDSLGGRLQLDTRPGAGMSLEILIPCEDLHHAAENHRHAGG